MKDYKRLTTDKPKNNTETMLNYAYAKDGEVYLRYADGENEVRLCEYVSKLAKKKECDMTPEDILEGDGCFYCEDCEVALLNVISIQAAELRHRLAELEDKIESCELGDTNQAVKEFAEMLEESYESLLSVEFGGKTEQQIYQRAGMEQGLKWAIEILKELCVADEKEQKE